VFLFDLSGLERGYRIVSFLSLGATLMLASFFYNKYRDRLREFAKDGPGEAR
jgi:uncharacterized membrane protein